MRGRPASRSGTRAASQAFERMHNTLSHRVKTKVPGGSSTLRQLYLHWHCARLSLKYIFVPRQSFIVHVIRIHMYVADLYLAVRHFCSFRYLRKRRQNTVTCFYYVTNTWFYIAQVFISAVTQKNPPLSPVQLLWVNLIMDTMGALALGTEEPSMTLLDRRSVCVFVCVCVCV